ncbi:MAG: hypothetical protein V4678_02740 [Patescibacteria group bacterium]
MITTLERTATKRSYKDTSPTILSHSKRLNARHKELFGYEIGQKPQLATDNSDETSLLEQPEPVEEVAPATTDVPEAEYIELPTVVVERIPRIVKASLGARALSASIIERLAATNAPRHRARRLARVGLDMLKSTDGTHKRTPDGAHKAVRTTGGKHRA